jgi:hypothetical protein
LLLGIGANTAIFSLIDEFLLKRPPVRQPERLVAVAIGAPGSNAPISSFSYPVFRELREKNSVCRVGEGPSAPAGIPLAVSAVSSFVPV